MLKVLGMIVVLSVFVWMIAFTYTSQARAQDGADNAERGERPEVTQVNQPEDRGDQSEENRQDAENRNEASIKSDDDTENSREHGNKISESVKKLLEVAKETSKQDRGIGDEVSKIAKEEGDMSTTTTEAIKKVENRNFLVSLLVGADLKNLGQLRSSIVTTENHINALNNIKTRVTADIATTLDAEIASLNQEKVRLESVVKDNEDVFSLFGWFVKLVQ